jgi:dipeptidyl aminopeptidase/acylaminoacyl peptidase
MRSDMSYWEENINIKKDIVYTHKFGMDLTLDLLQPKNNNGAAVLFFNSGGFYSPIFVRQDDNSAGSRWMLFQVTQADKIVDLGLGFSFSQLLTNGFTVFDIRHGSGTRFTLDEIVEDCRLAVQFIQENSKEFDIDPDRIGVWGMSAGGYLAAFMGANLHSHVKAVVSYFPTGYNWNMEEEMRKTIPALQVDQLILEALSLKVQISENTSPTLIIYGEGDASFITEQSDRIYTKMQELGVQSKRIIIAETGHLFLGEDDQYNVQAGAYAMTELIHWFRKYLLDP